MAASMEGLLPLGLGKGASSLRRPETRLWGLAGGFGLRARLLGCSRVLSAWAEWSGEEVDLLGRRKGGVLAQGKKEERKRITNSFLGRKIDGFFHL